MKPGQDLTDITSNILVGMRDVSRLALRTDRGDTTTLSASIASFYGCIPVGLVKAGLRTRNKYFPCPEEINGKV